MRRRQSEKNRERRKSPSLQGVGSTMPLLLHPVNVRIISLLGISHSMRCQADRRPRNGNEACRKVAQWIRKTTGAMTSRISMMRRRARQSASCPRRRDRLSGRRKRECRIRMAIPVYVQFEPCELDGAQQLMFMVSRQSCVPLKRPRQD